jgi:hypothetical protein
MSKDATEEKRMDMELKVRIMSMLKLGCVEGFSDKLGLPLVPIRPGLNHDD